MLVGNFRGIRMSFSPKKSLWTLPLTMTISNNGGILLPDGKTDCLRRHLSVSSKFKVSLLSFNTCTFRRQSPFSVRHSWGKWREWMELSLKFLNEMSNGTATPDAHTSSVHFLTAFLHFQVTGLFIHCDSPLSSHQPFMLMVSAAEFPAPSLHALLRNTQVLFVVLS